ASDADVSQRAVGRSGAGDGAPIGANSALWRWATSSGRCPVSSGIAPGPEIVVGGEQRRGADILGATREVEPVLGGGRLEGLHRKARVELGAARVRAHQSPSSHRVARLPRTRVLTVYRAWILHHPFGTFGLVSTVQPDDLFLGLNSAAWRSLTAVGWSPPLASFVPAIGLATSLRSLANSRSSLVSKWTFAS